MANYNWRANTVTKMLVVAVISRGDVQKQNGTERTNGYLKSIMHCHLSNHGRLNSPVSLIIIPAIRWHCLYTTHAHVQWREYRKTSFIIFFVTQPLIKFSSTRKKERKRKISFYLTLCLSWHQSSSSFSSDSFLVPYPINCCRRKWSPKELFPPPLYICHVICTDTHARALGRLSLVFKSLFICVLYLSPSDCVCVVWLKRN